MLSNHPNCLGGNGPSASSDLIGDVDGPASATDNAVARFDGTTGKLIQNSTVTIADTTGDIAGATSLTSPASTNLTLGTGSYGTALTVASATGAATFAGAVTAPNLTLNSTGSKIEANTPGTTQKFLQFSSDGAGVYFGIESSGAGAFFTGSAAYDSVIYTPNTPLFISTTTLKLKGAATISSTTGGSANVGALVVAGGISAGQSAQASYFGGAVTVSGNLTASGTGTHTFGTTNTVTMVNGAISASAAGNQGTISNVNGEYMNWNSTHAYGGYHTLLKDSTLFAYFGSGKQLLGSLAATDFALDASTGNFYVLTAGTQRLSITSTTATFAGAVSVGTGAAVGGATAGAGGLAFPATAVAVADANTLDDYEEGTWTGTMTTAGSGSTPPPTSITATGKYTKIGNVVNVFINFDNKNTTGASGQLVVTGLPFTATTSINQIGSVAFYGLSIPNKTLNTWISISTTTIEFISSADNGNWTFADITAGASKYAYIQATYLA